MSIVRRFFTSLMLLGLCSSVGFADFSLNGPTTSTIEACGDFATQNFKDPWDFSNPEDIPTNVQPQQVFNLTNPTFSNGVVSFATTSTDPHFSLTTIQSDGSIAVPDAVRYGSVFPIDTSVYSHLAIRMYTDKDSNLQVYWATADSFGITTPIPTYGGEWRTYVIDLATTTLSDSAGPSAAWGTGNKTQIRIDPSATSGANVLIDWVQLTKPQSQCSSITASFQGDSNNVAAVAVDTDTDLSNGTMAYTVAGVTGTPQVTSFNSALFAPGTYNVVGFQTNDYATAWGNPWDFSDTADVIESLNTSLSNPRFENGQFCATTTDGNGSFYVKLPQHSLIDTSLFKHVTVKFSATASEVTISNIQFFDKSGVFKGNANDVTYDTVNQVIEFDLSGVAGWDGEVGRLRIQPTTTANASFCVDWVAVTTTAPATFTEPTLPSSVAAPGQVTIGTPQVATLIQPDIKGGRDCPTNDLGNPWVMDNQSDVEGITNVENPEFRPYNTVTDSRGVGRTGDFFRGTATVGSDDPKVHPLLFSTSIDANRCVNLCYGLIVNLPFTSFQSVARVTYLNTAGAPQDGDDVISPDRWSDSEVCLYMPELQQEPVVAAGQVHPWNGVLNFLSLDPHEERGGEEFYIDYIELREDHKASSKFAIVVDAPLSQPVEIYTGTTRPTSKQALPSGASLATTLAAGRSSNVYLWDTSGVAEGKYYVSIRTNLGTASPVVANSPLPVTVTRSFSDTTGPTQLIDSPKADQKVTTSLQLAGAVFDNIRHAVSELYIDDVYQRQFVPDVFHLGARQQYASSAPDKPGFNFAVDISGLADGNHTVKIVSYDTAGNTTTYTATIVKGTTADDFVSYPDANAAAVPFATATKTLAVSASGSSVTVSASGYEGCAGTAVVAGKLENLSDAVTLFNGIGSVSRTVTDISQWVGSAQLSSSARKNKRVERKRKRKKKKKKKKKDRPVQLESDEIIESDTATCGFVNEKWVPGTLNNSGKFVSLSSQLKKTKAALKKAKANFKKNKSKKNKKRLSKAKKNQKEAASEQKEQKTICESYSNDKSVNPQLAEDGVIYFQARCLGSDASNTVAVNFGTQLSNPAKTTPFETAILQELQAKLVAAGQ